MLSCGNKVDSMFDRSVWRFPSCEDEDGSVGGMEGGGACLLLGATAEGDLLLETVSVATLFSDSRRFRLTMSSLEVTVPVPLALLLITAGEDFLACLLSTCTYSLQSTCTYTHTHTHTHTNTRTHTHKHMHTHTHSSHRFL